MASGGGGKGDYCDKRQYIGRHGYGSERYYGYNVRTFGVVDVFFCRIKTIKALVIMLSTWAHQMLICLL